MGSSSNSNSVLISIIMPVYNAERYLNNAIDSVINQTFSNWELIIVNDGSTDNSKHLINEYNDERIIHIQQKNIGQSGAFNTGIKKAKGNYIKFFDADDILHPEHLDKQYEAIKNKTDSIASCKWAYFYKNPEQISFTKEVTNQNYNNGLDWLVDSLTHDKGMMGAWMWLIPQKLLDKIGFWDERLSLNNDFDFSVRVLCATKKIFFASEAKIYYRKGINNSLSASNSRSAMESAILTTELGMQTLLQKENSLRIRLILANRFQQWIFLMYPQHKDLIRKAEYNIKNLGGSNIKPKGGKLFNFFSNVIGWKNSRTLQYYAYQYGWQFILEIKKKRKQTQFIKKNEI